MLLHAQTLLTDAADEMQEYHDDRSEEWQESERVDELLAKLELLQGVADQLQEI